MIFESVVVGQLDVNCYIIAAGPGRKALIIDPGDDEEKLLAALERLKLEPGLVANTHGHYDHIGCDDCFGTEVCVQREDGPLLLEPKRNLSVLLGDVYRVHSKLRLLDDGDGIVCDGLTLKLIHTPGHTPGGSCLLLEEPERGILFSGDTLFNGSVGRTDFPGGDPRALTRSLKRLFTLPDDTVVYPGHGGPTTIGDERRDNPYVRRGKD